MKIKIGHSRLYNAKAADHMDAKAFGCTFKIGSIEVTAQISTKTRHFYPILTVESALPIKNGVPVRQPAPFAYPSADLFPAALYLELTATGNIEIVDELADAFLNYDNDATTEVMKLRLKHQPSLIKALDCVAGIIGLRLHPLLLSIPIIEQQQAYRGKGRRYHLSMNIKTVVTDSFNLNSEETGNVIKGLPTLKKSKEWQKSSQVLAWLLRAWSADEDVLKFISFFTALESVVPRMEENVYQYFADQREAIKKLILSNGSPDSIDDMTRAIQEMIIPGPNLFKRFTKWATGAGLPGWENDIAAFKKFSTMRNALLHAGNEGFKLEVTVNKTDVSSIKAIAERYVCLALFDDAAIYSSRPPHENVTVSYK